ncbi:MAG: hypothetical protein IH940_03300 [Acidobacteria bacterium]|nr:hypothetical protein [Acidobacteriota bacterium]
MAKTGRPRAAVAIAVVALSTVVVVAVWVGLTADGNENPDGETGSKTSSSASASNSTSVWTEPQDTTSSSGTEPANSTSLPNNDPASCEQGQGEGELNDGVGMCIYGPPFDDPNFFPVATFSASADEAEILAAEGFNLVLTGANPPDRLPSWGGPKSPDDIQVWADNGVYVVAAYDMAEALQPAANNPFLVGFASTDEPIRNFGLEPEDVFDQFDAVAAVEGFEDGLGFVTFAGHTVFYDPRDTNPDTVEKTLEVAADERTDLIAFDIYPLSYCSENGFMRIFEECDIGVLGDSIDHFQAYSNHSIPVFSWTDARHTFGDDFPGEDKEHLIDAMVWLPINHGSQGVAWFTILPGGHVADYLRNPVVAAKVREINSLVTSLAPVLNSAGQDTATATSDEDDITMDLGGRVYDGKSYIFAVADASSLGDGPTSTATFDVDDIEEGTITELRSGATIEFSNGTFQDDFDPYQVKIYEITPS